MTTNNGMPNRLLQEKSPYLLQHARNPVDWYPWGQEAFDKARQEDKPVFLSIGYSTCHWCHVMERESFEDGEVAEFLNNFFVPVKVDREERPDVDHIYMNYCQALTGSGGWPLSVFITPGGEPFFAGTYFPKLDRFGMPGFISILERVRKAWQDNRHSILQYSSKVLHELRQEEETSNGRIGVELANTAFSRLKSSFDSTYGGFGGAPKFPTPHNMYFLIRYWYKTGNADALDMVEKTLDSMYHGGIFDHIGYGFSRYSTDRKWLVPHFEKMLYDNALLAIAYLEAFLATGKEKHADAARKIFTYVIRDMTSPEGAFYSAEDADSEGVEGKFYVWTPDEVGEILGKAEGERFCRLYDITGKGNFEGLNIPNLINTSVPVTDRGFAEDCRQKLFEYREKRVHPFKDDKVLTAWNGLMTAALAIGGRILNESEYTRHAEKALKFILERLVRSDGRLLARYRDGESSIPAYVDDYAFLTWSLIELYESTYKPEYLKYASQFNSDTLRLFWDEGKGGLFMYGSDAEQLIIRPKEIYDGAIPSGNSVAAMNFLRLARLMGDSRLEEMAGKLFAAFQSAFEQAPHAYSFALSAMLFSESRTKEVIITGESDYKGTEDMVKILQQGQSPLTHLLVYTDRHKELHGIVPSIENYKALNGKATAYICEGFSCRPPITNLSELREISFS